MTPARQPRFGWSSLRRPMPAAIRATVLGTLVLGMIVFGMTGCARHAILKPSDNPKPIAVTPPPAPVVARRVLPLNAIFDELERGRYSDGTQDLQQYLVQHPGDRTAKNMLHQLVADPEQMLGAASRRYVVQPGDSYSSLAAHYLGNPGSFVILARYNGSDNPSMLRVGEAIRLPMFNPATAHGDASPLAQAQRLQRESTALLDQGQNTAALARLGQALSIEPGLRPEGPQAAALREQLLASYDQHALALSRKHHLNQAVALWDRVLKINPKYAPAIAHRTRALGQQQPPAKQP